MHFDFETLLEIFRNYKMEFQTMRFNFLIVDLWHEMHLLHEMRGINSTYFNHYE